jgi:hypothetical protein
MKDEFSPGMGGVDFLGQGLESDASFFQGMDDFHQILERASKAIQAPDNQRIPLPQDFETRLEFRTVPVLAGNLLLKDLLTAGLGQCIELKLRVLVLGGHSGITNVHETVLSYTLITIRYFLTKNRLFVRGWKIGQAAYRKPSFLYFKKRTPDNFREARNPKIRDVPSLLYDAFPALSG